MKHMAAIMAIMCSKSVADCMKECLSGNQRLYHLIADQYVIVDLDSTSMDDAIQLKKRIGEKIDEFIISENMKLYFQLLQE